MPTMLWDSPTGSDVVCHLCAHSCRLKKGDTGRCGVRANKGGQMVSMVTDVVSSAQMDPVEKKPLYHFLPGSKTFSIGSVGCNFHCKFCQNHRISRVSGSGVMPGKRVTPEGLLQVATKNKARSLAFTYNEPTTFFELVYATAGLAKLEELPVILVTNGFMSGECLTGLHNRVHAANVDLKSFSDAFYRNYCGGRLKPVLDNLKAVKGMGWWLEVTTLVIPKVNDSENELRDCAKFIHDELGPDTPWHLSAFHGAFEMIDHPATSLSQLETAWRIGKEAGLHHVYIGNVASAMGGNTFCPGCGALVIERQGWQTKIHGRGGVCPKCGIVVAGVWK